MNKNSAWIFHALSAAALALGLCLGATAATADETPPATREMQIANAKTPAEHQALAAQYEQEARDEQAQAEEHKKMAKAYARAGFGEKFNLQAHCKKIADRYEEAAKESLAMAKIHRELAEKAK